MNVLHVNPGNLYGGVETFLVSVARHSSQDMNMEFAVLCPGRFADELRATGATVHLLPLARASRPWTVWRSRKALQSLAQNRRPDVVVLHQPWVQAMYGRWLSRADIPWIAHCHGPTGGGWAERLARSTKPDRVIAPSRHSLQTVREIYPEVPGDVLNYPIPASALATKPLTPEDRGKLRKELGASDDNVVILQTTRVEPWKGPDRVLQALGGLRDVPGWRFWFAGGPQRPVEERFFAELQKIAKSETIAERVSFLGSRSDVPRLMSAADIYCQGNRGAEGFSLAFLEASYHALPIVTTDLGGAGELIDDSTGILVPPDDIPALREGLRQLILDGARRKTLGMAARDRVVSRYLPEVQMQRYADLIVAAAGRPADVR